MARNKRKSAALSKGETRAASIKSIDPLLDLNNGLTLANYNLLLGSLSEALNQYNTDLSALDGKMNDLKALERRVNAMSEQMLSGVGAKFGFDSNEYEQAGGTRKSEIKYPPRTKKNGTGTGTPTP